MIDRKYLTQFSEITGIQKCSTINYEKQEHTAII